ncbi:MAG: hypothetical protein JWR83_1446 [Aeromicrobium sp.]|nr:hypothetical protein [Aeromicrobium sp.]
MKINRTFLLPVIAAALAVLAYVLPTPSEGLRPPSRVAVTQASYACPAGKTITVAAGQVRPGTSSTATVLPGSAKDAALANASTWRTSVVNGQGVLVDQQGLRSGAGGFFAGKAPKKGGGGLVVGSCTGVVDDAWLLGLGSGGKHFSTLILTNLANSPAVVDLDLWGPDGPIDAVDTKGIVVKSLTTRRIRLDSLAAGEAQLALQVHRRRGSLSAVVNDTSTAVFRGTEPVTATDSPRRDQVIGGLVEGVAGRTLELLNPGSTTARVNVSVLGAKNTFTPSGLSSIKVPAGALKVVAVPRSAGTGRQALRITSDLPVAATVRMAPSATDYAYAEAVPPLAGPALVPVALGPSTGAPDLILSAPKGNASAQVQAFDAHMRPVASKTIAIKGGTTQHLDSGKEFKGKSIAYLVVRATGEVIGAATYVKAGGISSLALVAAPVTVLGPQVRPLG